MSSPAVHPDVIRDLAPLFAAGEASAASAALVEAAAAADPALAREVAALRRAAGLAVGALPADLEGRALGEVRRAVRRRSGLLAAAIFLTALPLTFFHDGHRLVFLGLRDAPAMAAAALVAGVACWVAFARAGRALR